VSTYTDFNQGVIADLRANRGRATRGPFAGRELLILTTEGAKTGRRRENPLAFTDTGDADRYLIIASKGGAPTNPDWYHNLLANPVVGVEVRGESFRAHASAITEGEEYERFYRMQADRMPAFWGYRRKSTRKIPVVVLERVEPTS
jgi:deazaflavin-dependent oxidoreductase (nitroreductase family)